MLCFFGKFYISNVKFGIYIRKFPVIMFCGNVINERRNLDFCSAGKRYRKEETVWKIVCSSLKRE